MGATATPALNFPFPIVINSSEPSSMLPTHRSPPSIEHLSKFRPNSWFNKPRLRWLNPDRTSRPRALGRNTTYSRPLATAGLRAPRILYPPPSHINLHPMPKPPTLDEQRIWMNEKTRLEKASSTLGVDTKAGHFLVTSCFLFLWQIR